MLPTLCAGALVVLLACAAGASAGSTDPNLTCSLTVTSTATGAAVTSISQGDDVTLTATIVHSGGTLPAGTVSFQTSLVPSGIGSYSNTFTLSGSTGTAVLRTQSLPPGTYGITATYDGGALLCVTDPWTLTTTGQPDLRTQTSLALAPATFSSSDDEIAMTAHVVQYGQTVAPPGGNVTFKVVDANGNNGYTMGTAPLVDGYATYTKGGWTPGRYVLEADYTGDIFKPSFGQATLTSAARSSVTFAGPATAGSGETTTVSAALTDTTGGVLPDKSVTITIAGTGDSCVATTNALGLGSCPLVVHAPAGPATVDVSFAGDDSYYASSNTGTLQVVAGATTLAYRGDTRASTGHSATLAAVLRNGAGEPVGGQSVTLTLNGAEHCTAPTLATGVASCAVTVGEGVGTYGVTARFDGTADLLAADAPPATLDVVASSPTTLTWAGSTTVAAGAPATIAFVLASGGSPLAGQRVTITYGAVAQTVTTDGDGVASWPAAVTNRLGGPVTASASFAGVPGYDESRGTGAFVVSPATAVLALDAVAPVVRTDPVTLSGTLTVAGSGVSGEALTLSLGSQSCTTQATDADGRGSCTIGSVRAPLGAVTTAAAVAGDARVAAATANGSTTVVPIPTTLVLSPVAPVQTGHAVTLSATLTRTGAGPIAEATVTLMLGSQSCTAAPTNSAGVATCTIASVSSSAARQAVTADLPADDTYAAAHADGTAIVYAFPTGGAFVIGDRTGTTGTIVFWGSQWSKLNALDHGAAPNDFKGFAGTVATPTQCGANWTTRPGNSTPPPTGPLPAYMAVVVSSSIAKHGSAISGDVERILIVATDPGYASDPGHAGTGTVAVSLCG